jgi:hypothetical protein
MKHLIPILIIIHGAIHLLGFLKAYGFMKTSPMTQNIGVTAGIFWLISFLLFFVSVFLFYNRQSFWPFVVIAAILISQILIILSWTDARYGTILNIIILFVAIGELGNFYFDNMVEKEVAFIYQQPSTSSFPDKPIASLEKFPPIVQKWLLSSGTMKEAAIKKVFLKQKGSLKTSPSGEWMPFTAEQWFNISPPSFIWKSDVSMWGPLYFLGRDKLFEGKGSMLIKLNAIVPVVNSKNDPKIDEATMQRYMAEICWFPSAAMEPYFQWESVDELTAKASMTIDDKTVFGQFNFSPEGDLVSFETKRYMGQGKNASLEIWQIHNSSFKIFNGIRIPNKSEVFWKLADGDFQWLQLEISEIYYNDDFISAQNK